MKQFTVNELREMYLKFFERQNHLRLESFPLVPRGDNTLLLINAGMAPLKPYFTGVQTPPSKRVTDCQKCIRTNDIENVGKTSRHATFFEMLGNFSFGDYFKKEAIPWAWEFLTVDLGIPKDRLYATVYEEDDEAFKMWEDLTDIGRDRIFRLGKADNFWEIGVGPCGPCSEIHFDKGNAGKITTREEFEKASEEDKIVEVWNLVFTQFDKDEDGNYNRLAHPNIDTGMGLERLATVIQGVDSIFEIDSIKNIRNKIEELLNVKYGADSKKDISIRIITDHIKAVCFLIADGVLPSNEGRGYILRRLLRRASRHARVLGFNGEFLTKVIPTVIENYGKAYPQLVEKEEYISKVVSLEEEKFNETIGQGMEILKKYMEETEGNVFSGDHAFKLYDTYGFPVELTEEIVQEAGLSIDYLKFKENMERQKKMAKEARSENNYMGFDQNVFNSLKSEKEFEFTGYSENNSKGNIILIADDEGEKDSLEEGSKGYIILDRSPFYAEMGGQVGDTGIIKGEGFEATVLDTKKNPTGATINIVEVTSGTLIKEEVTSEVVGKRRKSIERNHTATHLLHKALKIVLGDHVNQAGSLNNDTRLRFDFNHFNAMTKEEIDKVEEIVNSQIMAATDMKTDIMSIEEAKETGAMALFDAKYGEKVRVVRAGDFSIELCGGTHVRNTGEIGLFKILSETGVAAGIRRIEAVTGFNALEIVKEEESKLKSVSAILKTNEKEVERKAESLMAELKNKDKEIISLKKANEKGVIEELLSQVKEVKGIKVTSGVVNGADNNTIREIAEKAMDKMVSGISVVASVLEDKVNFVVMVSKDLTKQYQAGKLISEIAKVADGKGGGRPDMAQAGAKNVEKAQEAIDKIFELI